MQILIKGMLETHVVREGHLENRQDGERKEEREREEEERRDMTFLLTGVNNRTNRG